MEEQLKKIIGLNGWYLDIHSVKDGFRDVCLVGLIGEDSGRQLEFNLRGVSSLPSMMEQAVFVGEYVERNMPQHKIIPAWAHLFFIADDSKVDDVEHLLSDYSRPVRFKNGERKLGLLLGYSECCVKAHLEDRLPY